MNNARLELADLELLWRGRTDALRLLDKAREMPGDRETLAEANTYENCANELKAALRSSAEPAPDLTDPVVVHANMLAGKIAKPTWDQIKHLYPERFGEPAAYLHECRDSVAEPSLSFELARNSAQWTSEPLYRGAPPEPTLRPSGEGDEYQRCLDMLADVPGATLEDRLTHYIGCYMALQIASGTAPQAPEPTREEIAKAVYSAFAPGLALPLWEQLAKGQPIHRKCFAAANAILALTKPRSET